MVRGRARRARPGAQAVAGYNVTVLAYGQTGSGKSLTMVGKPAMSGEDHRGLIPRIAEELFDGKTTMTRGLCARPARPGPCDALWLALRDVSHLCRVRLACVRALRCESLTKRADRERPRSSL
jgi:hypothetical protein